MKTTPKGARSDDGGKQVKGRKRHLVVDTQGMVLNVVVHPAHLQARDGAVFVLGELVGRFL